MSLAFVTHPDCSRHDTGWAHPEHQGRLPAVARAVHRDMLTLVDSLLELEGWPAEVEDLRLAHDPEYVRRVREATERAAAAGEPIPFENGSRVSAASWDAAVAAVGCGITAVDAVLEGRASSAFCSVRPPGSGAGRARSTRYALFNTAAIAALHLLRRRGLERVLVLEIGAAPGAGSAEILADERGARYLAIHSAAEPSPETEGVALPDQASGPELIAAVEAGWEDATRDFAPEFLLLSAGFDVLASDPSGAMNVEAADFHPLTVAIRERAEAVCGGRLVSILEGGGDPAAMGGAVVQHLRGLAGLPPA